MAHLLPFSIRLNKGRLAFALLALRSLCAVAAASLLLACGGSNNNDNAASEAELQPGSKFSIETPLPNGGMRVDFYLVHGVTTQGDLVADQRSGLIEGALVPLLEEETRSGKTAPNASNADTLLAQQRTFYKQAWDAMAQVQGSSDPRTIVLGLDDMDARIVDFMDDAAVSGVSLTQYLAFYERLDSIPKMANLMYAELILQEALASVDKVSVFDEAPPACPPGLMRVVSASGLSSYCRNNSMLSIKSAGSADTQKVSNVRGLMDADNLDFVLTQTLAAALENLTKQLEEAQQDVKQFNLAQNDVARDINMLQKELASKPVDCERQPICAEELRVGQIKLAEYNNKAKSMESMESIQQINLIRLQSLNARFNEGAEVLSSTIKKMQDTALGLFRNLR